MAEFRNDGERDAHVAALEHELEGYVARENAAKQEKDTALVGKMANRQQQVRDEIKRITGEGEKSAAETPVDDDPGTDKKAKDDGSKDPGA